MSPPFTGRRKKSFASNVARRHGRVRTRNALSAWQRLCMEHRPRGFAERSDAARPITTSRTAAGRSGSAPGRRGARSACAPRKRLAADVAGRTRRGPDRPRRARARRCRVGTMWASAAAPTSTASPPTSPAARPCCSTATGAFRRPGARGGRAGAARVAAQARAGGVPRRGGPALLRARRRWTCGACAARCSRTSARAVRARASARITMQLARNVFPDRIRARERTLARKLLEVRVAREIEDEFEKDEILELYLNHIYFGNGARGIEAAARHYFGVPARELTLAQAALLAALPKGPSHYDPRRHARDGEGAPRPGAHADGGAGADRQAAERGAAREGAAAASCRGARPPASRSALRRLVRRGGAPRAGGALRRGPLRRDSLRIHTTLDVDAQRAAEEELRAPAPAPSRAGALGRFAGPRYRRRGGAGRGGHAVPAGRGGGARRGTGDVLAWVGGRDFRHSRFDRVRARAPPGGQRVQAVRLRGGAGRGPHAEPAPDGRAAARAAGRPPRLGAEELRRRVRGPGDACATRSCARRTSPPCAWPTDVGLRHAWPSWRRRRASTRPISASRPWPLGTVAVSPLELAAAYTVVRRPRRGPCAAARCRCERLGRRGRCGQAEAEARAPCSSPASPTSSPTRCARRSRAAPAPPCGRRGSRARPRARPAPPTTAPTPGSSATRRRWWPRSGSASTSRGRSWRRRPAAGWPRRSGPG